MRLKTLLGSYPVTQAIRDGRVRSSLVDLEIADVKVPHTAFKRVVRDLEFDVAEIAIVTFLMARSFGKPYKLLPAVMFGRFQHPYLMYNAERGKVAPKDLEGRRVAIRSNSVTTVAWVRGILADDHGVDLSRVRWITFEEAHVAEFRDPPNSERAPHGKTALGMLLDGEVDAAVLSDPVPEDPRLRPVIPDPQAAAAEWHRRKGALQVNHMVCVRQDMAPEVVREVYRMLRESKRIGAEDAETCPFGFEANRRNIEVAVDYLHRQGLIPARWPVDDLFDDVTRNLA
jgi:4,5-dihydroxyphthalate decarboxylase